MSREGIDCMTIIEKIRLPIRINHPVTVISQGTSRRFSAITIQRVDDDQFALVEGQQPDSGPSKQNSTLVGEKQGKSANYSVYKVDDTYVVKATSAKRSRTRKLDIGTLNLTLTRIPEQSGISFNRLKQSLAKSIKDSQHLMSILLVLEMTGKIKTTPDGNRKLIFRVHGLDRLNGYV